MKWLEGLTPFESACNLVLDNIKAVDKTESVPLLESSERILAENLFALINVPPFDRAAMDGYALKSDDTLKASANNPVKLKLAGSVFAGATQNPNIKPGECVYIATGAKVPSSADAVLRVEDSLPELESVSVLKPVSSKENIALAGEDIRKEELFLNKYTRLAPAQMGALSSQGLDHVKVFKKPRIAVMTTGDELAQPGCSLRYGQIYDVNSTTLMALIKQNMGSPYLYAATSDSILCLEACLAKALEADMVVISGGSSVGERDYMFELLSKMGDVLFYGLNIKPGKPTLFARIQNKPVLALPGYPTSCIIVAYLLLKPALRKMSRLPGTGHNKVKAKAGDNIPSNHRKQFIPVKLVNDQAIPVGKESGAITATAHADGYITLNENSAARQNDTVEVTLF